MNEDELKESKESKELKELYTKIANQSKILTMLVQAQTLNELLACRELAMKITGQKYSGKD
jgi:hypothetical protein